MPSTVTHAYLAKDIYSKLSKKIQLKIDLEDYKTYSQGLDILYFYHILFPFSKKSRSIVKLGRRVHKEKTNELLIKLTEIIKKTKNEKQFVYLIGLVTHYIADSTMHPYINYHCNKNNFKNLTIKDKHFIMETYLDNYLINYKEKYNYKKFKAYKFCFNVNYNQSVIDLLNISFKDVFKEENVGLYYFKALKEMKFFFKYLRYDPYKIKRIIYQIINPFVSLFFRDVSYLSYNFDLNKNSIYLNNNHDKWQNLSLKKIESNESFIDLYQLVIDKTIIIIDNLYSYIYLNKAVDLEKLYGNKSYANGLVLNDK